MILSKQFHQFKAKVLIQNSTISSHNLWVASLIIAKTMNEFEGDALPKHMVHLRRFGLRIIEALSIGPPQGQHLTA